MLQILKTSILSVQVCTDLKKKKDIEIETNKQHPCGTDKGWMIDEKESKRLGQAATPCENDREKQTHYILYA